MNPTEPKRRRLGCAAIVLFPLLFCYALWNITFYPWAKVTARVVDDAGNPIKKAQVSTTFVRRHIFTSTKRTQQKRKTGKSGKASAFGRTSRGVYLSAQKTGFYKTHNSCDLIRHAWWHWKPWNPTVDLPLRRIGNPVPMCAKRFSDILLPEASMEEGGVGYDLLVGDWVEPHGKGTVKDMVFSLKRNYVDDGNFDAELRITMSNPGDGFSPISPEEILEGSEQPLPSTAHEEGYVPSLVFRKVYHLTEKIVVDTIEPNADSFFLRVRTQLGPDGKVESAMYGKLVGHPFWWSIRRTTTARIDTTSYYVNPDGTRNVEFDPKRNLLQGLDSSESPRKP